MADRGNRVPDSVAGAFYVDKECIDCDLCREVAAENFERNEDEGHSFVRKQPETAEELAQCREALESCPVEAIGDDGEEDGEGGGTGAAAPGASGGGETGPGVPGGGP